MVADGEGTMLVCVTTYASAAVERVEHTLFSLLHIVWHMGHTVLHGRWCYVIHDSRGPAMRKHFWCRHTTMLGRTWGRGDR